MSRGDFLMKKNSIKLTTDQFAKLHEVNKRTLHYYDMIGLFCPKERGDNGYRYYDVSQSIDFQYIRMLKELNMTIQEIEDYYKHPTSDKFIRIVCQKVKEIDDDIQKLVRIKKILQAKKEQVVFCDALQEKEIRIEEWNEKRIYILPFDFQDDEISQAFPYIKNKWSIEQIRMGIGGYISIDKVIDNNFEKYDGIFTPALGNNMDLDSITMPKGNYLCGYQQGTWDKLPIMYANMLTYAKDNGLKLTGYAYEQGLNEFVISTPEEYITKIMIKIDEKD